MAGILSISPAYNPLFRNLLKYYGIKSGHEGRPLTWGRQQKEFGYFTCKDYPDQLNLFRLFRVATGGFHSWSPMFGDMCDLTGALDLPYKYHIPEWDIPSYIPDNFELCMEKAVQHYVSNFDHCTILCSGGVDSSGIVCAFIKYATRDKFSIAHTHESVKEHPYLFKFLAKNNFTTFRLEDVKMSQLPGIIIHGNCGDSVLTLVNSYAEQNILLNPWQSVIKKWEWEDAYDELMEFSEYYMTLYGKEQPTVADLCIFIKTVTRYNYSYSHFHYDQDLPVDKMSSFFKFGDFDGWAYHHGFKPLINSHLPTHYKLPLKKIVFSVLKDENYLLNKSKGLSQHLWDIRCNAASQSDAAIDYFFIDYTGERVKAKSFSEYREKYGTRFDSYFIQPSVPQSAL
jgi:hypothetical protein